jgi:hypothetical protein
MESQLTKKINNFVDAIQNMTPRGSFYDTKNDKIAALQKLHTEMKNLDEDLYKLFMFYPGINDYNRLSIVGDVLSNKRLAKVTLPMRVDGSNKLPLHRSFAQTLRDNSYPRTLKLFLELRRRKVNNKRLKRTALEFLLGDPKLVRRAVTYRIKMREVLEHMWGKRTTGSIIQHLINGGADCFLDRELLRYRPTEIVATNFAEAVLFILGADYRYRVPLLKAYQASKDDIDVGLKANLPYETMMGFRNKHFTGYELKVVTEKTAKTMTAKQKVTVATKAAKKRSAKVEVDYSKVDPATVYREAYRGGELSRKMLDGVERKVGQILSKFSLSLNKTRLIIDNSQSMGGIGEQENEAISRVLSIAKFLEKASTESKRFYTNETDDEELPSVGGETSFAKLLVRAAKDEPDTIFILTDGYENAPEGLTDLVVKGLRHAGSEAQVVQINPTFAAESSSARSVSKLVPVLPISDLSKLEGTFMKVLMERNETGGIEFYKNLLLSYAAPYLANQLPEAVVKELKQQRTNIDFGALT